MLTPLTDGETDCAIFPIPHTFVYISKNHSIFVILNINLKKSVTIEIIPVH